MNIKINCPIGVDAGEYGVNLFIDDEFIMSFMDKGEALEYFINAYIDCGNNRINVDETYPEHLND